MTRENSYLLSEAVAKQRQQSGKMNLRPSIPHRPLFSLRPLRLKIPSARCLVPLALLCCCAALASGFSKSYSLGGGTVTVSNNQKRSSWVPVALLFHFTEPVNPTVSIKRLSDGNEFLLSTVTLTNVQDVTWIPEADYPFNYGDSLIISTTETNGTLEIIQRSE